MDEMTSFNQFVDIWLHFGHLHSQVTAISYLQGVSFLVNKFVTALNSRSTKCEDGNAIRNFCVMANKFGYSVGICFFNQNCFVLFLFTHLPVFTHLFTPATRLFFYPLTGAEHGSQPSLTFRDRELVSVLEQKPIFCSCFEYPVLNCFLF